MNTDVRVALVGIGGYGAFYVDALLRDAHAHGVRFVAGIDPAPVRSPRLEALRQADVPIFDSLDAFYRREAAELVVLAAPIHLHAPLTCLALAHRSNVLCEKPLCARLEEADRMAEAARAAGRFVAIGYQWSFSDAVQALKREVLAGAFGRPQRFKTLVLWPRPRSYYGRNAWAGRIRTDAGDWVCDSPVNNATAHYLHNMLYLLGDRRETSAEVGAVEAQLWRANAIENYDAAALQVMTTDGVTLLMFTAHAVPRLIGPLMAYEFEDATVTYGPETCFRARWRDGRVDVYGDPADSEANKLWQTVAAVRTGAPLACDMATARPHAEIVNRLQALPVMPVPADRLVIEDRDGDTLVWARGLEESFRSMYEAGRLRACSPPD